ncbi:MAG TPA: manganese efflux pump, partial [Syntrophomonas sp.]|nr:manganese efflux pump [Syntrophomonas sp.]
LGAGAGMALTGMNILFTAVSVGMVKFILINTGICAGQKMKSERWQSWAPLLTGLILVAVAIIQYV